MSQVFTTAHIDSLAPVAVAPVAVASTLAPMHWEVTSKAGKTTAHSAHSATAQALAPRAVRLNDAQQKDMAQLKNGNFAAVREALATFKGKALATLQSEVISALSQVQDDGTALAPVIPWDNVRAKSHAVAVAREICNTSELKGKKATMRDTLRAWLDMENAGL